ncbi:hypothetical protein C2I36_15155 [Rhodobacteraceae bacterium WD3A24]|nr:hypothetical protein C2I36_15155 [Rhodobacteraceae bacterium WD3A24]
MTGRRILTMILIAAMATGASTRARADAGDFAAGLIGGAIVGALVNEAARGNTAGRPPQGNAGPRRLVPSDAVHATQTALNRFGFNAGTPDGLPGPSTRAAFQRYQRHVGYEPTRTMPALQRQFLISVDALAGQGGAEVTRRLDRLGGDRASLLLSYMADPVDAVLPTPEMVNTSAMQRALNRMGYEAGPVDGAMGPSTRGAIARWRADAGSPAHGAPGPQERVDIIADYRRTLARAQGVVARPPAQPQASGQKPPQPGSAAQGDGSASAGGAETGGAATTRLEWRSPESGRMRERLERFYNSDYIDIHGRSIDWGEPPLRIATADLDGDRGNPAIFVLWRDSAYCGARLCQMHIWNWQGGPDGGDYARIGDFLHEGEISLAAGRSEGMRDIRLGETLMRWNGASYSRAAPGRSSADGVGAGSDAGADPAK